MWTGAYLLERFKTFSSDLAARRKSGKKDASEEGSLKLNIINKLGNLLETGDNNQLEHIEKYLIDLNLDGSMGVCSDVSSTDSKAGSAGGKKEGNGDPSLQFLE